MSSINLELSEKQIQKICRICVASDRKLVSLFTTVEIEDKTLTIPYVLWQLFSESMKPDDRFPHSICVNCIEMMKTAYSFKLIYDASFHNYNEIVQTVECMNSNSPRNSPTEPDPVPLPPEDTTRNPSQPETRKREKPRDDDDEVESDSSTIKPRLHPCPVCTREFPAEELRQHAFTHKSLKNYVSIPAKHRTIPMARFKANPLDASRQSVFNQLPALHKCLFCDEKLEAGPFRIHIARHRNEHNYKCDKCERVFRRVKDLNIHRLKHMKELPYQCEHCNKGFVIERNYECHILTHTESELPHECKYCSKRFSNPEHLNRHIIIHTENVSYSVKYKVIKCYKCQRSFSTQTDLQEHQCATVPCAKKPPSALFPCKSCNKVFKYASSLYTHNRGVHTSKAVKTLCSTCGKYTANIYSHMLAHTGERPFECHICGKRFALKPRLKQHLLVHSGLKPYVCSACAKPFNNLYNLHVHERIHKGDRCHVCSICQKGFLEKSYLKKHMNVHKKV